jgi:hypothetical protein
VFPSLRIELVPWTIFPRPMENIPIPMDLVFIVWSTRGCKNIYTETVFIQGFAVVAEEPGSDTTNHTPHPRNPS